MLDFITVSRVTEASAGPVQMLITTDRVRQYLAIPGPMESVRIPGRRLFDLQIQNPELYGIRIVANGTEYRLEDVPDFETLHDVQAILIYDGFVVVPTGTPGYVFRPEHLVHGRLLPTGK